MHGSDFYKRKYNEAKMLFTPTLEINNSKSHELAEERVYSSLSIHFSSYTVLKVFFCCGQSIINQMKNTEFQFFLKGNAVNVIYEYNNITINAVSKS